MLPEIPYFPDLPDNQHHAVNMLITLCNQSNYLTDRLITSLMKKHEQEGGFNEQLYKRRKKYRGF